MVVVSKDDVYQVDRELKSTISVKTVKVVSGGDTRQQSVFNGLKATDKSSVLICVHDAVRPFVTETLIDKVIQSCDQHDGVILAQP